MKLKVIFEPEARVEYIKAKDRYLKQQKTKVFQAALQSCLDDIALFPEAYQIIHPTGVRKIRMVGFPYNVLYFIDPNAIYIMAIAHQSRDNEYWIHRIPTED